MARDESVMLAPQYTTQFCAGGAHEFTAAFATYIDMPSMDVEILHENGVEPVKYR